MTSFLRNLDGFLYCYNLDPTVPLIFLADHIILAHSNVEEIAYIRWEVSGKAHRKDVRVLPPKTIVETICVFQAFFEHNSMAEIPTTEMPPKNLSGFRKPALSSHSLKRATGKLIVNKLDWKYLKEAYKEICLDPNIMWCSLWLYSTDYIIISEANAVQILSLKQQIRPDFVSTCTHNPKGIFVPYPHWFPKLF